MKVAALDLGSNTFLCLIAEVENQKIIKVFDDQVEVVRLGQGLSQSQQFHPEALQRAELCLTRFAKLISQHKPDKVLAVATAAARTAKNKEALEQICTNLEIPLKIISGSEEAECTFLGAISHLEQQKKIRAVIDVGGGSTEIIIGALDRILFTHSFPIGSVKLTEQCIKQYPLDRMAMLDMQSNLEKLMAEIPSHLTQAITEVVAVAGTPTELAKVEIGQFDPLRIEGHHISNDQLQGWIQKFAERTPANIEKDFGVSPGRSDVICAGAAILLRAAQILKQKQMTVSIRGIRYGVALSLSK